MQLVKGHVFIVYVNKNMKVHSKSGPINSNFHKHRERFPLTLEKFQFNNAELAQIDETLNDALKTVKINISILLSRDMNTI